MGNKVKTDKLKEIEEQTLFGEGMGRLNIKDTKVDLLQDKEVSHLCDDKKSIPNEK